MNLDIQMPEFEVKTPTPDLQLEKKVIGSFDFHEMDDLDKLGDLELNELDNIVTFADNIATQLAVRTT